MLENISDLCQDKKSTTVKIPFGNVVFVSGLHTVSQFCCDSVP